MSTSPLSIDGPFGAFASDLLALELPALDEERRDATVAFVVRRARSLPTPLLIGVSILTVGVGLGQRLLGSERTTAYLSTTTLPFVGELARMVRSLGVAYIWEAWPHTLPDGADGSPVAS